MKGVRDEGGRDDGWPHIIINRKKDRRVKQSYFLKRDKGDSSSLHLSLRICPSVPSWPGPDYLTLSLDKEVPKYVCVHECGTQTQRGKGAW